MGSYTKKRHALQISPCPARCQTNFDEQTTKINLVLQPHYVCIFFKRYNPYRNRRFWFFQLILLFLSLANLTSQKTIFSGCFINECILGLVDLIVL